MDAVIESEEESEQRNRAPCVGMVGLSPPTQHHPQNECREDRGEHIRSELNRVFPQCGPERECQGAERCAQGGWSTSVAWGTVWLGETQQANGDDVDEPGRKGRQRASQQIE